MRPTGSLRHSREALLTPAEMAVADAASTVPIPILMANAGRAIARAARRFGPCRTLVLCGPGNNGGDGRVAAALLARWGWPVAVALDRPGPPVPGTITVPFDPAEAARAFLVIDAVFGAGFRGMLPDRIADVLAAAPRILAVDVPSGLDGGTGQPRGRVRAADLTITFARRKPGHLLLPGRAFCGKLILADIGLPDAAIDAAVSHTWRNTPALFALPTLGADGHKYTRGHVTIIGGAEMVGAARLAGAAARRGGAGLVTIAAATGADIYKTGAPGVIVSDAPLVDLLTDPRRQVWVAGPGLGQARARDGLPALLAAGRTVVADADALTAFADDPAALHGCAVLTPHAGEFTRLFGNPGPDKLAAVRAAAARVNAVVLLKGADTIIAAPDGRAAINDGAPPWLATAGSGDVLAGLIGAVLAQGLDPWEAACAGVWLHGRAGHLAGPGLIAEDLPPLLPQSIADALHERSS